MQNIYLKITVLWDTALKCYKADIPLKRRSTSTKLHSAISQKVVIFILVVVGKLNMETFT
jgi:hypothetical protein